MQNNAGKRPSKTDITIPDEFCMQPEYWVDYSTASKNEEFINNVKLAKEIGPSGILDFINQTIPGWIIDICDEYDSDLSKLSTNWSTLCNRFQIPTQKILLVKHLSFNEKEETNRHKNLNYLCDVLTSMGFVVKDVENFMCCKGCHKLMLSEKTQKTLWNTNKVFKVCRTCTTGGVTPINPT